MTSNQFFARLDPSTRFDLDFLDGPHTYTETYADVMIAFAHLTDGGVVMVDDVVPINELAAIPALALFHDERARQGSTQLQWIEDVLRLVAVSRVITEKLLAHDRRFRERPDGGRARADTDSPTQMQSDDVIASYASMSFADVFGTGTPAFFAAGEESEVITDVLHRVGSSRQRWSARAPSVMATCYRAGGTRSGPRRSHTAGRWLPRSDVPGHVVGVGASTFPSVTMRSFDDGDGKG